jgi:hypothetical protein
MRRVCSEVRYHPKNFVTHFDGKKSIFTSPKLHYLRFNVQLPVVYDYGGLYLMQGCGMRIRITLMRIRVQLLFKVMEMRNYWSIDHVRIPF